jgi:hypothetical protein
LSLAHSYTINGTSLNESRLEYVRTRNSTRSTPPLNWFDVGVTESEMCEASELPNLNIVGSVAFASAFPYTFTQNSYVLSDTLSIIHGAHALRFGGSLTRFQDNFGDPGIGSFVQFLSWPDFLLGLNGADNGTKTFSNLYASLDDFGVFDRNYRVWEGSLFEQDDYRIRKSPTLNVWVTLRALGSIRRQFGPKLKLRHQQGRSEPAGQWQYRWLRSGL